MIFRKNSYQGLHEITMPKLTQKQMDVLALVAQGYTNCEIANKLFISKDTVKTHLKSIYNRFDFSYCHNSSSVFRLKAALLWIEYERELAMLSANPSPLVGERVVVKAIL